jgi:hypothetical protein
VVFQSQDLVARTGVEAVPLRAFCVPETNLLKRLLTALCYRLGATLAAGAIAIPLEPIPGIDLAYDIGLPIALIWYWFSFLTRCLAGLLSGLDIREMAEDFQLAGFSLGRSYTCLLPLRSAGRFLERCNDRRLKAPVVGRLGPADFDKLGRRLRPLLQHPRPLPDRQADARTVLDRRGE